MAAPGAMKQIDPPRAVTNSQKAARNFVRSAVPATNSRAIAQAARAEA